MKGLTGLVQARVPSEFTLILAHECRDQGRSFAHLTFGDGRHLLSVLVARRERGESLGNGTRQAARDDFQLAAFESSEFFVYTVSDLPARANADILAAFAPGLRAFLDQARQNASRLTGIIVAAAGIHERTESQNQEK